MIIKTFIQTNTYDIINDTTFIFIRTGYGSWDTEEGNPGWVRTLVGVETGAGGKSRKRRGCGMLGTSKGFEIALADGIGMGRLSVV